MLGKFLWYNEYVKVGKLWKSNLLSLDLDLTFVSVFNWSLRHQRPTTFPDRWHHFSDVPKWRERMVIFMGWGERQKSMRFVSVLMSPYLLSVGAAVCSNPSLHLLVNTHIQTHTPVGRANASLINLIGPVWVFWTWSCCLGLMTAVLLAWFIWHHCCYFSYLFLWSRVQY